MMLLKLLVLYWLHLFVGWMDRECYYFILTAGLLEAGTPYTCCCKQQVDSRPIAPPERVRQLTIALPKIAEIYYST
jgi:hypothetical protein